MKDEKLINVDQCMKGVQELIGYFERNAERMPGSASPQAKEMRNYSIALKMAFDALKEKYYST